MEELLNCRVLWGQYSQRMAEVMLELRRLQEWKRNLNERVQAYKLTRPLRNNILRQSRGGEWLNCVGGGFST